MIILRLETRKEEGIYYSGMWTEIVGRVGNRASEAHPMAWEDDQINTGVYQFMVDNMDDFEIPKSLLPYSPDFLYLRGKSGTMLRYGFLNSDQYLSWVFDHYWRKQLAMAGIQLCYYEVDDKHVLVGKSQVLFIQKYAKMVSVGSPLYYDGELSYA